MNLNCLYRVIFLPRTGANDSCSSAVKQRLSLSLALSEAYITILALRALCAGLRLLADALKHCSGDPSVWCQTPSYEVLQWAFALPAIRDACGEDIVRNIFYLLI